MSHDKFMQDTDELIEKKKKYNENLQGILNALRNGEEIDPESLKSAVKTEEQMREEREKEQALKKRQQQYTQHYQELKAEEERLQKQRAESAKQAEEQRKANEKLVGKELEQGQHKLAVLDNKTQQTDVKLAAIYPKMEDAKKMKDDIDKKVEELGKIKKEEIELEKKSEKK